MLGCPVHARMEPTTTYIRTRVFFNPKKYFKENNDFNTWQ